MFYLKYYFAKKNVNDKFFHNQKIKDIDTLREFTISIIKAKELCIKYDKTKRLEDLLYLMKGDYKLYEMIPLNRYLYNG